MVAGDVLLPPMRVFLRDVSAVGLGLASPVALEDRGLFVLLLTRPKQPPMEVMCMVQSCVRASGGDTHHVGATFLTPLDEPAAA